MTTDSVTILPPTHALAGKVSPPGSKSITNRALLLAGLAKGTSRLTGALKSDDTRYMAEALRQMGVTVEEPGEVAAHLDLGDAPGAEHRVGAHQLDRHGGVVLVDVSLEQGTRVDVERHDRSSSSVSRTDWGDRWRWAGPRPVRRAGSIHPSAMPCSIAEAVS